MTYLVHGRYTSHPFTKNKANWFFSTMGIITFIIRVRSSHYRFMYTTVRRLVSWCVGTPCPHSPRKPFVFSITCIASTAHIPVVFHIAIYHKCFPTSWLCACVTYSRESKKGARPTLVSILPEYFSMNAPW